MNRGFDYFVLHVLRALGPTITVIWYEVNIVSRYKYNFPMLRFSSHLSYRKYTDKKFAKKLVIYSWL